MSKQNKKKEILTNTNTSKTTHKIKNKNQTNK